MTDQTIKPTGELTLRTLAMPADANPAGDIFGGWVMSQMDLASGIRAAERSRCRVVTAAVKEMAFELPVKIGDTLSIYTDIARVGRTSITLTVEAWAQRSRYDKLEKVTAGTFIMVAMDEKRATDAHSSGGVGAMEAAVNAAEAYSHIRAVMGMVVGLSLARLLTGLAGFVQHPKKERIYPLHIGWVAFLFLMLVHFWWWEHRLSATGHVLGFGAFLFLILFCSLFYFLCVLLFPTEMKEYKGYEDYFLSRKSWFFAFLAALFVTDVGDTLLKGQDYLASLGPEYLIRTAIYVILFTLAIFIENRRFHRFLVIFALIYQIAWIFRTYDLLA